MPIKVNRQGGIGKHNIDSSTYHTGLSGSLANNLISTDANGLPQDSGYGIETVLSGTPNKIATSEAVKTYVDDVIPSYDALIYKGAIDCALNPNYPAADCGWLYKISVAGRIGGALGKIVEANDVAICTQDSTPSGDEASVGQYWDVIQANLVRALLSPESSIDNRILVYSGTSGLVARDSGYLAQDATTSQKGFAQLSNSYSGVLETLAVTEKALSDGLAAFSINQTLLDNMITINSSLTEEEGVNYQTISGALSYLSTIDPPPSSTNRWVVLFGGANTENFSVPRYVTIRGIGEGAELQGRVGSSGNTCTPFYDYCIENCLVYNADPRAGYLTLRDCVVFSSELASEEELPTGTLIIIRGEITGNSSHYIFNAPQYLMCYGATIWYGEANSIFNASELGAFYNCHFQSGGAYSFRKVITFDGCVVDSDIDASYIDTITVKNSTVQSLVFTEGSGSDGYLLQSYIGSLTLNTGNTLVTASCRIPTFLNYGGSWSNSGDAYNNSTSGLTSSEIQSAVDELVTLLNEKSPILTSGNLSVSSPLHQTGGENSVIGLGVTITIDDASTSQKGVTQLSNSYSGSLENKSVTEKALSDGLALKQGSLTSGNLTGTANQINVSNGNNSVIGSGVVLSLPQDISPLSSPVFNQITLSGTVPLIVTYPTRIDNLNAQYLNGKQDIDFSLIATEIENTYQNYFMGKSSGELTPVWSNESYSANYIPSGSSLWYAILYHDYIMYVGFAPHLVDTNNPHQVTANQTNSPELVNPSVSGNFVAFNGETGAHKDSGFSPTDFVSSSGNLIASFPLQIDDGLNAVIGFDRLISILDATTSQKGVTQLSNSYSGSLETKATTEKALSDGLALKQNSITSGNLTGTANQINVSNGSNSIIGSGVVLSLPQDIAPTSSPIFDQVTLSSAPTEESHATTKSYVDLEDSVIPLITHEPTGFESRTTSSMSFNSGTLAFTITPSGALTFNIWSQGVKYEKGESSVTIDNTKGLWYIYFSTSGTLARSQDVWNFVDGNVPVATVYWDNVTSTGIVSDERHGIIMDGMTHGYLHYAIGVRYISGLTGTFTNTTFSITSGVIYDEDIRFVIAEQTQCRVFYRESGFYKFTSPQTKWYVESGDILQYDNNGVLTPVDNNRYIAMWVFASNDINYPIHVLVGQNQSTTLAEARSVNTYENLSLLTLPSQEMKAIYRIIVRRNGTSEEYIETQDLRSVSNLPAGTYVATSHGILTGLTNDDHTQYLLANGTRALTGDWDAGSYEIRAQTFESDVPSGTAPFIVASPTRVDNLNVQFLNGKQDTDFVTSSGNLIATSPLQVDNGVNAIIGANRTISIQDASTSQKGAVQLSDSYSGTSQSLSVTEKALSDGLSTKQNPLTSGNLITTSPIQIDNGVNAIIGSNRTISILDASTSQKGTVQLSDSYSGSLQTKAVTEKALSDGLATKQSTLTNPITGTGTSGQLAIFTGTNSITGGASVGDVSGPASSTNGNLAIFDGTTGKLIKDGGYGITATPTQNKVPIADGAGGILATGWIPPITEAMQTLANNTTGNVSTSAHGYCPKAPNNMTYLLDGTGAWSVRRMIEKRVLLVNYASDTNNDITFQSGWMYNTTGAIEMSTSGLIKRLDAGWSAGTNQGGLATGSKAANTWYHCFLIKHTNGTVDAGFDTNTVATNLLSTSGYSYYRYLGSILTDASSNIIQFYQVGDTFLWKSPVIDWSGNLTSTASLIALNVPLGFRCFANIYSVSDSVSNYLAYFSSPDCTNLAPSTSAAPLFTAGTSALYTNRQQFVMTNASSQIRGRTNTAGNIAFDIATIGYRNFGLSL